MAPPNTNLALLKNPPKNLTTIRNVKLGAAPEQISVTKKKIFVQLLISRRPYNSHRGPQINGPTAYPATNMEIHNAPNVSESLPNSSRTEGKAGANITPEAVLQISSRVWRQETIKLRLR